MGTSLCEFEITCGWHHLYKQEQLVCSCGVSIVPFRPHCS